MNSKWYALTGQYVLFPELTRVYHSCSEKRVIAEVKNTKDCEKGFFCDLCLERAPTVFLNKLMLYYIKKKYEIPTT